MGETVTLEDCNETDCDNKYVSQICKTNKKGRKKENYIDLFKITSAITYQNILAVV